MKYRIKILRKEDWDVTDPTYCIEDGDIIELEPINEPKCACGLKECICSPMRTMKDEPEETLDEKLSKYIDSAKFFKPHTESMWKDKMSEIAQIAKEHHQKHPEEIDCILRTDYFKAMNALEKVNEGMVSHDKVLEVFDEAADNYDGMEDAYTYIKKALENMKDNK